jgi:hypothetical protein
MPRTWVDGGAPALSAANLNALEAELATALNPSTGYDIVVFTGQSNGSGGNGEARDALIDVDDPRVFSWPGSGSNVGKIVLGRDGLGFPSPDASNGVAPALEFGRWWALANPGRRVLVVPAAVGGTSLIGGPWAVGGAHYNTAISLANGAVAAAGANSRVVAIVWQQGENEGWATTTKAAYATAMDATLNGLRAAITGASTAKIIVGGMVPFWRTTTPTGPSAMNVHAAHVEAPTRLTNTLFVDGPWGLVQGFESVHYSAEGARVIGRSMAKALAAGVSALAVPAQVTGLAGTKTSTTVTLTWAEPAAHPRVDTYSIEYRLTGGSTWTAGPTVKGAYLTGTVTGLTVNTGYDFRVTATNQIGAGTPSAVLAKTTDPVNYAGGVTPALLFDARNFTLTDGAAVDAWPDVVSGKNAVQATSGNQPVYQANGLGTGKPCVYFTGGKHLKTTASLGVADMADASGYFTVITVATRAGTLDSGVAGMRQNLDPAYFNIGYSSSGSKWSWEAFAGSYAAGYGNAQQAATAIDVPTVLAATRGSTASISVNSAAPVASGAVAGYTSTKTVPLTLGGVGFDGTVTSPMNGRIGYFAIYRGVLTGTQIDAIEADLATAFGATLV